MYKSCKNHIIGQPRFKQILKSNNSYKYRSPKKFKYSINMLGVLNFVRNLSEVFVISEKNGPKWGPKFSK